MGVALGVGEIAAPECRNFAGTARDSGYPCRIDRSSGDSEYLFSRTRKITVPHGDGLAIGLVIARVIVLGLTRRR